MEDNRPRQCKYMYILNKYLNEQNWTKLSHVQIIKKNANAFFFKYDIFIWAVYLN